MQLLVALYALAAVFAIAHAAPAPTVDRLSIVSANRARMSSYVASSISAASASSASVASAVSASAARESMISARLAVVASNRARMSEYMATANGGFITAPASLRPTSTATATATASPSSSDTSSCGYLCHVSQANPGAIGRMEGALSAYVAYEATCSGGIGCTGPHLQPTSTAPAKVQA